MLKNAQDAALDLPLPTRNFSTSRRVLVVVLLMSIIVPVGCLIGYAYQDYYRRAADAYDAIERLARVAQEHALKVMDLNSDMTTRILELLDSSDASRIRANERLLHERLDAIGGNYPQVAAIAVFGPDGRLLVSSRYSPAPDVSILNREDFTAAQASWPVPYISLPMRGSVSGLQVFNMTSARRAGDGRFLGVVSVALRRDYFTRFYSQVSEPSLSLVIGLCRRDGAALVSYPVSHAASLPFADKGGPSTPLTAALRDNAASGVVRSAFGDDGIERVAAFRRVGDYPLYVAVGYANTAFVTQWWHHCVLIAALLAIPCMAVWSLVLYSLRQLTAEELAFERWRAEMMRRISAEAATRHLQRMGALGNLVASIAHDFNNLLLVVSANMAAARRRNCSDVDREVSAVERAIASASTRVRGLLSVAKKLPFKSEVVRFEIWLPSIEGAIRATLGGAATLSVVLPPQPWPVLADASELELAILNVTKNARDAMPRGSRFSIRVQNMRLSATSDADLPAGDYVLIALTDNGDGMSEDVARRAFEPLFTTRAGGSGTGLGLAQVLSACERSGGTAKLHSLPGRGTTVRLYLPRHQGSTGASTSGPESGESRAGILRPRVLIVEDNPDVAAALIAALELFDVDVQHEADADAALRRLESGFQPDFLLSDVQMPGHLSGIDLAERVRVRWPTLRMALMTGYAEELERARRLGIPVLAKPFDMHQLHALISGTDSL